MDVAGKTILITGATDGVGRAVARALALDGATVLIHGRSQERGRALLAELGRSAFYAADLASLDEVRRLAAAIQADHQRLDVLINNAGIGAGADGEPRQLSADGHELRFAVNYLAPFLLTRLLLPQLKSAAPSRIVNVASIGQQPLDFGDVMLTRGYHGWRAYNQSKLALIMFTFDLAAELEGTGVTANALHPATLMPTTMVREAGIAPRSTLEDGRDAILNLAAASALEGRSGLYYDGKRPARADAQAYDTVARRQLAELSRRLTGL